MGEKIETLKAEFKKIIWPDQRTVVRETTAVVVTGVLLGIFLAILDTVIKFGLSFIL
ncbi:MAG: preprotein translocase subunit SecE [Lachnospiraceae bacterium]|nr:preprotein translocase subunit SecE [Lachnospiraceae bacterium]MCD8330177.1 preprotein translocase subunit SecE [Lachnospiraceae bacterium]